MSEEQLIKQYSEDKQRLAKRFNFMNPKFGALKFGYGCPKGSPRNWFNLVWVLCEKIEKELQGNPKAEKNFLVLQVKEKFGGLRFYVRDGTKTIIKLIREAEAKSLKLSGEIK